jgi:hypothetical protein
MEDRPDLSSSDLAEESAATILSSPASSGNAEAVNSRPSLEEDPDGESRDTHMHKRPRLDSGASASRGIRSRSADLVYSPSAKASSSTMESDRREKSSPPSTAPSPQPAQMPNKITIHVRSKAVESGKPSELPETAQDVSPGQEVVGELSDTGGEDSQTDESVASSETARDDNAPVNHHDEANDAPTANGDEHVAESPVSGSSPSVPIEIDEPEEIGDGAAFDSIEVEDDEDLVDMLIRNFPYCHAGDNANKMARDILHHLEAENGTGNVEVSLLKNFIDWFQLHERFLGMNKAYWHELYLGHQVLWTQVAHIVGHISNRT